jgi:hypothetical protein
MRRVPGSSPIGLSPVYPLRFGQLVKVRKIFVKQLAKFLQAKSENPNEEQIVLIDNYPLYTYTVVEEWT